MAEVLATTAYKVAKNISDDWNADAIRLYALIRYTKLDESFVKRLPELGLDMEFVNMVAKKLEGNDSFGAWLSSDLAESGERIYEAIKLSTVIMNKDNDFYGAILCGLIGEEEELNQQSFKMLSEALGGAYDRRMVHDMVVRGVGVESIYSGSLYDIDPEILGVL